MTPLHKSVLNSNHSITKLILGKGPYIDVTDLKGNTPLHLAASFLFQQRYQRTFD